MDTYNNQKVIFESENLTGKSDLSHQDNRSGLVRLVIRLSGGRIKEERQANLVLVLFAIFIIIISVIILFIAFRSNEVSMEDLPIVPSAGPQRPDFTP